MKLEMENQVPMEYLAREELQLGGFHLFADTRARSRRLFAKVVSIVEIYTGVETFPVGLPDSPIILQIQWSPNGEELALLLEATSKTELWHIDLESGKATKLSELAIHAGMDHAIYWASDSLSIIAKTVPSDLGLRPVPPKTPKSAILRETSDEALPAQTHQGVLRTLYDVEMFEYFFKSQIVRIGLDGSETSIGESGIYCYFRESPDSNYMVVERLVKPWSFLVNQEQFAYDIEIWDLKRGDTHEAVSSPVAEYLPYGGGSVRRGVREFQWRSDKAATLVWIDRKLSLVAFNPSDPKQSHRRLLQYEFGDRYRHPGLPLLSYNKYGFPIIATDASGEHIFLLGEGASLKGYRPFLDRFNINTKRKKRLFRSDDNFYENVVSVLDPDKGDLLVTRESIHTPPNYFVWNPKEKFHKPPTWEENPFTKLETVGRQQLRYKRKDGVALTAELYLPPGYDKKRDGPLPTLVWAYPRAYQSANNAQSGK